MKGQAVKWNSPQKRFLTTCYNGNFKTKQQGCRRPYGGVSPKGGEKKIVASIMKQDFCLKDI